MYNFSQLAIKLLQDYKTIVKKQLSVSESEQKLAQLRLNERLPNNDNVLYKMLINVVQEEETDQFAPKSRLRYCGISQLLHHIKKILGLYRIENKKVVNSAQLASKAIIDAIQIMALPKIKRTEDAVAKLDVCVTHVAKHGTSDQKNMFDKSLKTYIKQDEGFFKPFLQRFQENTLDYD